MRFKITTIPPEGRNQYGNYYSSDRMAKSVMRVTYNGNASTGGNKPKDPVVEPQDNIILFLGKTMLKFDGQEVAVSPQTQTIDVMGYINSLASDTYVGDLTNEGATNYGIVGLPESGMTITVENNGTPNTKIKVTIDENVTLRNGNLVIPCTINKKPDSTPMGNDWEDWHLNGADNMTLMLECQWEVSSVYENSYVLELSNEIAGINCNADGNILAGATRPTCQAELYLGQTKVQGATYGFTTPADKNATGISIDTTTGILTFGSNFSFDGTTLEVKITASANGTTVFKIMSIVKQFPGSDGTPAITRWVVPSNNSITYNPNNGTISPASITCKCMKQVGEDAPVEDTGTTIYYGYDTTNPLTTYTGTIIPNVSKSYLVFGIKNAKGEIYEIETIQIIKEGKDGINGGSGESVYRLDLSNDNASINCDADGNILAGATRPTCTATLYYGASKAENVSYEFTTSVSTTGLSINASTGALTFGSNFTFGTTTTTTLEITITAKIGGVVHGTAIMTVSRNYAGKNGGDGEDAITFWLNCSSTSFSVDGNGVVTPSSFSIQVMKQIGENAPVDVTPTTTGGTIQVKYGHNTLVPSTQYKNGQTITVDGTKNYITVQLYVNNNKFETETLLIVKDGKNGQDGGTGPQGRQGAAVRGPVDWRDQTSSRRWCNGVLTSTSYPEDGQFIDIVVYDGVYYKCKTSYTGKGGSTAPSSTYWEQVSDEYKFIAADLILAQNGKINFQSSNELYLLDNNGNVTAGAAGGNGISFWAGSNEPENGKFLVNYDGTMTATKGKFGVLEIGTDAWSDGLLGGEHTQNDGTINTLELQPQMFSMEATSNGKIKSRVRIGPYADLDHYDMEGEIFVELQDEKDTAIATNAFINAEGYRAGSYFATFAPMNNLAITFITDTNYFTKSGDYWYWKGMQMSPYYRTSSYPYVKLIGGEWCFCYTSTATTGVGTGIYGTSHTKSNNKIYIVI